MKTSLILIAGCLSLTHEATATIVVYEDTAVRVEKTIEEGFVGLTTYDKASNEKRCRAQYQQSIGAKPETLDHVPLTAALICHRKLPLIRDELVKGEYRALMEAVGGAQPLEPPITYRFISDDDIQRMNLDRGLPIDWGINNGALCWVWHVRSDNSVYCRNARWINKDWHVFEATLAHELVHLAFMGKQTSPRFPGWLNESMADYVAYKMHYSSKRPYCGKDEESRYPDRLHYTEGYKCGAALLDFAVRHDDLDLAGLATDLRDSGATNDTLDKLLIRRTFKDSNGLTLEKLWHRCLLLDPEMYGYGCAGGKIHVSDKAARDCPLCRLKAYSALAR